MIRLFEDWLDLLSRFAGASAVMAGPL